MLFSSSVLAAALLSTCASAASLLPTRQNGLLAESSPWELSYIKIYVANESNPNSGPSTVDFDIRDRNPGLKFNTHCHRTVPKGGSVYDGASQSCGPKKIALSWSLDKNNVVYITRSYTDSNVGPPGMDRVTCFGNWALNPHPFEVRNPKWTGDLLGTNYTQRCLDVYCTAAIA